MLVSVAVVSAVGGFACFWHLMTCIHDAIRAIPAPPRANRLPSFSILTARWADLGLIYEWFYDFSRQLNVSKQPEYYLSKCSLVYFVCSYTSQCSLW